MDLFIGIMSTLVFILLLKIVVVTLLTWIDLFKKNIDKNVSYQLVQLITCVTIIALGVWGIDTMEEISRTYLVQGFNQFMQEFR